MKFPVERAFAWVVFLGVLYGGYTLAQSWENPFSKAASPVLSALPADAPGCGEQCK